MVGGKKERGLIINQPSKALFNTLEFNGVNKLTVNA